LDEVQEVKGLTSDYALAQLLGVKPQTISNYRQGRTQMSDEMALRVARMMGRPAALVLVQIAAERAKSPDVAKVWREAARILAGSKGGRSA
jgi:plasmid maintenance system antidote protein VapI